jgi:hypothetical protein
VAVFGHKGGIQRDQSSADPGPRQGKRMNKYERLKQDLLQTGMGTMKCFGNSMLPLLTNPSVNSYRRQDGYAVGDIVFCKVKGRYIDAHKITKIDAQGRYLISNNHGYDNGWTSIVYGRVVETRDKDGTSRAVSPSFHS